MAATAFAGLESKANRAGPQKGAHRVYMKMDGGDLSSRPEESHPRARQKPRVNLSIHTASDVRPLAHEPPASLRPRAPTVARRLQLARSLG